MSEVRVRVRVGDVLRVNSEPALFGWPTGTLLRVVSADTGHGGAYNCILLASPGASYRVLASEIEAGGAYSIVAETSLPWGERPMSNAVAAEIAGALLASIGHVAYALSTDRADVAAAGIRKALTTLANELDKKKEDAT